MVPSGDPSECGMRVGGETRPWVEGKTCGRLGSQIGARVLCIPGVFVWLMLCFGGMGRAAAAAAIGSRMFMPGT